MWLKLFAPFIVVSLMSLIIRSSALGKLPQTTPKSTVNKTNTINTVTVDSSIFKLPTQIDEDELLHEVGLFMQSVMNLKVEPCENFYEYACGNWRNSKRVTPNGRKESMLHAMQAEINNLIVAFLKNTTSIDAKTGEGKAKTFYSSCISGGKDIAVGLKTLQDNEKQVFQTVQINGTNDWIAINFMSPYAMYPLMPLSVNYSTSTRKVEVSIDAPTPALESFFNSSKPEEHQKIFGPIATEFKLMLEFERNLTSKLLPSNKTERLNLHEFLAAHQEDSIDWHKVFKQAFGEHISEEWYVNNRIGNFTDLERFLRKSNSDNLRNYVKWRTFLKFYNIWMSKLEEDESREQICRQHTETYFPFALIPWFVEQLYDSERRQDTLILANSIKESFLNMIAENKWLDEETRSHITSKLEAMDIFVGFKDEMRHRNSIDEIYKDISITTDWFKNLQTLEENNARIRLNSVHKTVLPPMLSPYSVNSYYAYFINTVFVTMGISQMPLYHTRFPASLKFGGLGMLIGHEMAHSVDSKAYHMDYDGKHYEWPSNTLRHFKEKARCLENQYNKFIYRGIQTNGSVTMPDNIADNAATRLAYNSYKESEGREKGLEKPLPELNFNNNELFFIKFAQTWCTGRDETYKLNAIHNDIHAYPEFRVIGTLRNMHEFSKTFRCKLGSQMNPLRKCVLW